MEVYLSLFCIIFYLESALVRDDFTADLKRHTEGEGEGGVVIILYNYLLI